MSATVSVITGAWNAAWCIPRALDSALAQTVPAAELLVCDDGSTDGTPDLVERRYGDRVRVLRLPHRNASAARAAGLAACRGDWIAFLDADDWWEPNKLERQFAFLARHPEVCFLSSDGVFETEGGVLRASWLADYFAPVTEMTGDLFPALVRRCFPLMSSCLVRRDAYESAGGIDAGVVYSHDYDLWLRVAARHPAGVMPEPLVHYWFHPGSLSRRMEGRRRDDLMLMERVARGELRDEPEVRRTGRARAASIAFDLGLALLREGRAPESRACFARARAGGPLTRRAFAAAGALLPGFLAPAVRRLGWLKSHVAGARERSRVLPSAGGAA